MSGLVGAATSRDGYYPLAIHFMYVVYAYMDPLDHPNWGYVWYAILWSPHWNPSLLVPNYIGVPRCPKSI